MGLVRILVDGFSLLHKWPEIAPGKPRHSVVAREELIRVLTRYQDSSGTPITLVFDGTSSSTRTSDTAGQTGIEVLYTQSGQTADDVIERVACRLHEYGDFLVVTDDFAERDMAFSFGAFISSCANFRRTIESENSVLDTRIRNVNRKERKQFGRAY